MAASQQIFDLAADALAAGAGYSAQKLAEMSRNVQIAVTVMTVLLGAVMIAQGSIAIQTFNTLKDCRRGEETSAKRNTVQIWLLAVGIAVLVGALVAAGFLYKTRPK
jgi:hypothetical protein